MLSIDLSQDVELRLKAVAAETILEHLEDVEDLAAAEREFERVQAGEPTIPWRF